MSSVFFSCLISLLITLTLSHFREDTRIPINVVDTGDNSVKKCELDDPDGCDSGYCCVKVVVSFQDLDRDPIMSTVCHQHLTFGQLCLKQPEGYLCDCAKGLTCDFKNNETYGHCMISKDDT